MRNANRVTVTSTTRGGVKTNVSRGSKTLSKHTPPVLIQTMTIFFTYPTPGLTPLTRLYEYPKTLHGHACIHTRIAIRVFVDFMGRAMESALNPNNFNQWLRTYQKPPYKHSSNALKLPYK